MHVRYQTQAPQVANRKPRLVAMQIDQEWLVTDVHNNHVVFGAEEISEVVNTLMGVPSR